MNLNKKYHHIIFSLKRLFFLLLMSYPFVMNSQSLTQEVLGNSGGTYEQANGSLQFQIGESVIETYNEAGYPQMYLGFEQGSYSIVSIEENRILENTDLTLYPNPSNGIFYLNIKSKYLEAFDLHINDQLGKQLVVKRGLKELKTEVNLTTQNKGVYYISVQNSTLNYFKTFKVIKQ